jgi:tripartite-type tricarboxylate transporter receptor subunit TctC
MGKVMRAALTSCLMPALFLAAAAQAGTPQVQDYPNKPIRFVVGFSPGGGTDTVARILAQKIGTAWGQSIVVDNRPGAGGVIASELVAKAAPDGYTILFVSASFTITPSLQNSLPFDPLKDFSPVSLASSAPYLLVVHPSVKAYSVKDLISLAKAQPGKLNYASAGIGSGLHLAGELFKSMANVDIVHVPYKGAVGITDLLAGAVQLSFAGIPQTIHHVKAGRLRALAVTSSRRAAAAPEVPTIAESGVPGYEMDSWYGVLAPARVPKSRTEFLSAAIRRTLEDPDVKEKLAREGHETRGTSPGEFSDFIKKELAQWSHVVRNAGIKVE